MNKQIIEMKKYGKFLHGREEGSFAFRKLLTSLMLTESLLRHGKKLEGLSLGMSD